ncbi:hypothetical protein RA280_27010 [Cupriavidus sp. CV2]|uniref:hypothetical protein n=1 Tax=Cupriavidus ulmosensis TaxID=3065913 RepID=UPI00296B4DE0|nr:hypothetical protein [Cupriavidus sp. CV2]MDW3685328.1 hypothetical protein [Cupriavidus sp. CV2]
MLNIAACTLAMIIFVIDAFTPLDIAVAVLYVLVILMVALTGSELATRVASAASLLLTMAAYLLSPSHGAGHGQEMRSFLALLVIGATTLLALRNLEDMSELQRAKAALARREAFLAEAQQLSKAMRSRTPGSDLQALRRCFPSFGLPVAIPPTWNGKAIDPRRG